MGRSEIEAKVKQVIVNEVGQSAANLTMDTSLRKDIAIDSYSALQILFELEEAFSITIPDQAIKDAEFPKDIVDYLEKRVNEAPSTGTASA
ncbi:MAG: hypothetical protein JO317_01795 [Verrucomicrobiae bacterium]|nr:hypothetical protein [Verrucomicrobiae bacterium]